MPAQLNPTVRTALETAIWIDHPCEDRGCDIAVAREHGFIIASALLLTSATETPAVNAVTERYGIDLGTLHDRPFEQWAAWHRKYGRKCEACESYMYANPDTDEEPDYCSNCRAMLPEEQD